MRPAHRRQAGSSAMWCTLNGRHVIFLNVREFNAETQALLVLLAAVTSHPHPWSPMLCVLHASACAARREACAQRCCCCCTFPPRIAAPMLYALHASACASRRTTFLKLDGWIELLQSCGVIGALP
eukprot:1153639-Pelagomonas_calceolata.AAC.6